MKYIRPKTKRPWGTGLRARHSAITLYSKHYKIALRLGEGNVSAGIRAALEAAEKEGINGGNGNE